MKHSHLFLVLLSAVLLTLPAVAQDQSQSNQKTEEQKKEEERLKSAKKIIDNQDKLKEMSRDDLTKLLAEQMEQNSEFLNSDPVLRNFIQDKLKEYRNLKPEEGPPLEEDEKLMGQLKSTFGEDATPQKILNYGQMQQLANRYRKAGEWEKELTMYQAMRDMFKNNRMQYFLMSDSMIRILVKHGKRTEAVDVAIRYFVRFIDQLDRSRGSHMLFSRIGRAALADDDWEQAFQCYRITVIFRNSPRIKRDVYWPLRALAGTHQEVLSAPPDAKEREQLKWFETVGKAWRQVPPLKVPGAAVGAVHLKLKEMKDDDVVGRARLHVLVNEIDKAIDVVSTKKELSDVEWELLTRLLIIHQGDPRIFMQGYDLVKNVGLVGQVVGAIDAHLNFKPPRRDAEWKGWRAAFVKGSRRVARNEREDLARIIGARVRKGEYKEAKETIAKLRGKNPEKLPGHALPRGETLDSLEWVCDWRLYLQQPNSFSVQNQEKVRAGYAQFRKFYPKAGVEDFLERSGVPLETVRDLVRARKILGPALQAKDIPELAMLEVRLLIAEGEYGKAKTLATDTLTKSKPPKGIADELKKYLGRAGVFAAVDEILSAQAKGNYWELPTALTALIKERRVALKTSGVTKKDVVARVLDNLDQVAAAKQFDAAFIGTARLTRSGWIDAELGLMRLGKLAKNVKDYKAVLPALVELTPSLSDKQAATAVRIALRLTPGNSVEKKDEALGDWAAGYKDGAYQQVLALNAMRVHYRDEEYALALVKAEQLEHTLKDRQDYLAFFRGLCLLRQKETAAAIKQLKLVVANHPKSIYVPRAKLTIGLAYLKAGDNAKGKAQLQSLIKEHSQSTEAKQAFKILQGIRDPSSPRPRRTRR